MQVTKLLEMMDGKTSFTIKFLKNKIKIDVKDEDQRSIDDSIASIKNLDFRILKMKTGEMHVLFLLRKKIDGNINNNKVIKDSEIFPFLDIIPREYNLYAENYQAEIME